MKKSCYFFLFLLSLCFSGCSRLDLLTQDISGEAWLDSHSYAPVSVGPLHFILAEPSSTLIVYGLGLILLLVGISFLKNRGISKSKFLWGIALVIWAISTFSAGTSYQAFSYEIKYEGRTLSLWTSWWEIWYLILFVVSMNLITAAVAFSSTKGKIRTALIVYSLVSSVAYSAVVLTGALLPNQFMASFECMVLFSSPTFIILLLVNTISFIRSRKMLDLLLVAAWIGMLLIVVAYFAFYVSAYAAVLWQSGIWFNENDVLHIGLIFWVFYLVFVVEKKIEDAV